jgi:diaminopimelate epimerase
MNLKKKLKFVKMEGIGNDYVYFDATQEDIQLSSEQIQFLSNRNFGIGSDGVIFIRNSEIADFKMDMYNSDGSSSEMCGNGVRCLGKFVYDNRLTNKQNPRIETGKGVLELKFDIDSNDQVTYVTVDMGEPILESLKIPTTIDSNDPLIHHKIEAGGKEFEFTAVSMGNPHAVIFVDDANLFPVKEIGPILEHHKFFPRRTNVEFVSKIGENHFFQRTWERGAGETLACGTGACSVAVAANLTGRSGKSVRIDLLGGTLYIEWNSQGHIIMKGPATTVFSGEIWI